MKQKRNNKGIIKDILKAIYNNPNILKSGLISKANISDGKKLKELTIPLINKGLITINYKPNNINSFMREYYNLTENGRTEMFIL